MITNFSVDNAGILRKSDQPLAQALWIDLFSPTPEERLTLLQEANIIVPTHHETYQLEFSNRFYEKNNALYLSVNVITRVAPTPEIHTVTFILTQDRLVTLRFTDPNPIKTFIEHIPYHPMAVQNHWDIFFVILKNIIGRVADIFEIFEIKTDQLSQTLKYAIHREAKPKKPGILNQTLSEINNLENILSECYGSLSSLRLLSSYLHHTRSTLFSEQLLKQFETIDQDITVLFGLAEYITQKLEFQLEFTLGLINLDQTYIIKIFTVLAMIFMPPTLIASIYGMNFRVMPELHFAWGYPLALALMIITAFIPYRYFKRRGWI